MPWFYLHGSLFFLILSSNVESVNFHPVYERGLHDGFLEEGRVIVWEVRYFNHHQHYHHKRRGKPRGCSIYFRFVPPPHLLNYQPYFLRRISATYFFYPWVVPLILQTFCGFLVVRLLNLYVEDTKRRRDMWSAPLTSDSLDKLTYVGSTDCLESLQAFFRLWRPGLDMCERLSQRYASVHQSTPGRVFVTRGVLSGDWRSSHLKTMSTRGDLSCVGAPYGVTQV